jgi:hypothetical protein
MAYNVENLSTYVAENKDVILRDIVFGSENGYNTIQLMQKELGVKGTARIHPTTIEAVLQDANGCGFTPQGGLNIGEITVETKQKKVNSEFCPENLLKKFAEYKLRIGAANQDALPFEAEIVEGLVKEIHKQIEDDVWGQLLLQDGDFNSITLSGNSVYNKVMQMYKNMDEKVLEDGIIFISPSDFRAYVMELVEKNLYHYNPADGALDEIFLPGSSVKVKKCNRFGSAGNCMYATSAKNLVYATDFMSNAEEIKIWFSDDDDVYKVKARFNYGAVAIFPELVTKGSNQ